MKAGGIKTPAFVLYNELITGAITVYKELITDAFRRCKKY
jgi:hypothetical protein